MNKNPRQKISETLTGDVLEIGPGSHPFPTAQNARVKYVDRSVEGGRDANWPELSGQPHGIDADFDLNLDSDALSPLAEGSFDCVVASHVLEHLANPVRVIQELERVLRPGGKLVLILPDRTKTFDSMRTPTDLVHVLDEFHRGVTAVSDEHIIEFCQAIYEQPSFHPEQVREWHNPAKLDDRLLALHRRRSIHVHCWSPEEFAILIAGLLGQGLISFTLHDIYFDDDLPDSGEFGLVLERSRSNDLPKNLCTWFVDKWVSLLMSIPERNPRRLLEFHKALNREASQLHISNNDFYSLSTRLLEQYGTYEANTERMKHEIDCMKDETGCMKIEINELKDTITQRDKQLHAMSNSTSWRCTAPLRKVIQAFRRFS
ncbi:MAG: class I SAM-dependent methyltransferase [Pseudomonadota bacterium]